jgi:outer membrane protein assembly factor BamE (lipoprotein component of BamABCDE complex)
MGECPVGLWRRIAAAFGIAASLGGCDAGIEQLKPGVSTAQEVRAVLGEPTYEWRESDGVAVWEFAGPRAGYVTYMVTIGADGVMRALHQVLTDEYFAKVRPGMDKTQIRRLLGRPMESMAFPARSEEVWTWRHGAVMPEGIDEFHVHFDSDGKVVATSRSKTAEPG